jgi:two-component system chemotaxis sensor kinase CheA
MTEREVQQLIFAPGFSTATEITSVSGRGVGRDVVRTNVEQAGGRVEMESRAGAGTTLRLRVPLTLAIVPALVVECAGQSFALPQASLVELVHVPAAEVESAVERIGATELYRLRDRLLPLVRLGRVLEMELESDAAQEAVGVKGARGKGFYIVVLEPEGRRFGLVLDGLRSPEEIVVKPLPPALREIGVYAGTTVLGNGSLAMILDAAAIAERAGLHDAEGEWRASAPHATNAGQETARSEAGAIAMENAMVVYERGWRTGDDVAARMAVPLSAVERIATVPLREVEDADGTAVLQYDGDVISLEDEGGVLGELRAAKSLSATVLICSTPEGRRVGVVVRRVVDVCPGELLPEDAALCASPLARVKERITAVHRGFGVRAAMQRQPVDAGQALLEAMA